MPPVPVRRKDLKPGEILCSYCTARCCRYFALPIDAPKTWKDFDNIRWYMMHGRVGVFVDQGTWYLVVYADCQNLRSDNLCGVYEDRPEICRAYSTSGCEYDNDFLYDKLFETPDQIWEYAEAVLPLRRRKRAAAASLPIVSVS
jgi:Fe-S-cluster containining protein